MLATRLGASPSWLSLRPRFQSMVFALGHRGASEFVEACCGVGVVASQVFKLVNGRHQPQPRTLRDIALAVERWEAQREPLPVNETRVDSQTKQAL